MEHEPEQEPVTPSPEEVADLADYVRSLPERDSDGFMLWNDAQKEVIIANLPFVGFSEIVRRVRHLLGKGDDVSRREAGTLIEELRARIKDTPGL